MALLQPFPNGIPESPAHAQAHSTPRRRKTPGGTPSPRTRSPESPTRSRSPAQPLPDWPVLGPRIPTEHIVSACDQVFGYEPHWWQLTAALQFLEGKDVAVIAGTGAGKSLFFALLGLAAALSETSKLVIVICPLKALQEDQVRRLDDSQFQTLWSGRNKTELPQIAPEMRRMRVVAINEDNNDEEAWKRLEDPSTRILYASPEILLSGGKFKSLFRTPAFRSRVIGFILDEAHVTQKWKDDFRKSYGELNVLKTVAGSDLPWAAVSATMPTQVLNTVGDLLKFGTRPFWGADLGADRDNLRLVVRPMESTESSFESLFAFLPDHNIDPRILYPDDLPKTMFYFPSRRKARDACDTLRALLPERLRECLFPYTASNSTDYKTDVLKLFQENGVRWLFCTDAAGLGCDVPDVLRVVIYGAQDLAAALQKAGRGGRSKLLVKYAEMVWLIDDASWAALHPLPDDLEDGVNPLPTSNQADTGEDDDGGEKEIPGKLDTAAQEFVRRSAGDACMRDFVRECMRPKPSFTSSSSASSVQWTVMEYGPKPGRGHCCSARCCSEKPDEPDGLLTQNERVQIQHYAQLVNAARTLPPPAGEGSAKMSVARSERDALFDTLEAWREQRWHQVKKSRPYSSARMLFDPDDRDRIVAAAHRLVVLDVVTPGWVTGITRGIVDQNDLADLCLALDDYRRVYRERREREDAERRSKKARKASTRGAPSPSPSPPPVPPMPQPQPRPRPRARQSNQQQGSIWDEWRGQDAAAGPSQQMGGRGELPDVDMQALDQQVPAFNLPRLPPTSTSSTAARDHAPMDGLYDDIFM